jgi:hypothetical protein
VRAGEIRRQRLERRAATITTLAKAKKSVALSGVPAGNTALCTVGRTGDDLHYRGYDILDLADRSQFEEGAPADPRQTADHHRTHGLQGQAARDARAACVGEGSPGVAARQCASHGRHAHRRVRGSRRSNA